MLRNNLSEVTTLQSEIIHLKDQIPWQQTLFSSRSILENIQHNQVAIDRRHDLQTYPAKFHIICQNRSYQGTCYEQSPDK